VTDGNADDAFPLRISHPASQEGVVSRELTRAAAILAHAASRPREISSLVRARTGRGYCSRNLFVFRSPLRRFTHWPFDGDAQLPSTCRRFSLAGGMRGGGVLRDGVPSVVVVSSLGRRHRRTPRVPRARRLSHRVSRALQFESPSSPVVCVLIGRGSADRLRERRSGVCFYKRHPRRWGVVAASYRIETRTSASARTSYVAPNSR
jgi:hypothetical protein